MLINKKTTLKTKALNCKKNRVRIGHITFVF